MEAVAADALFREFARQGEGLNFPCMRAMEGRIEAGHLRQRRLPAADRTDGRQIVRLMQRRKRREAVEFFQQRVRDEDRLGVFRPAVHDAMADSRELPAAERFRRHDDQHMRRLVVIDGSGLLFRQQLAVRRETSDFGAAPMPSKRPLSSNSGSAATL